MNDLKGVLRLTTIMFLFVGLVGICFCGCENQGQKVERLIKELKHRKAKVRANAAMALFNPPNAVKGAVPALIPLLQDEDATVRTNAIYSLGCIGESSKNAKPIIVPALIQALHQDARICANVVMALVQIGTPEAIKAAEGAVPTLIQALQDPDMQVRANAIYALDSIVCALDFIGESTKDAVPALMLLLKDQNVRLHALKCIRAIALRQIGTPEAVKVAEGVVPALIQALQDPDIQVRANAIYALDFIGESATDAVPALILLLKDLNEDVRIHAARALGQIGSKDVVPALIQVLQDQDVKVRQYAAWALGQIGTPEAINAAVDALIQALQDHDEDVRLHALEALGQIGSKDVVPALILLLKDKNGDVRGSAAFALGWIGESAVPALIKVLKGQDEDVHRYAVFALKKISIPEALKAVEEYQSRQ